MPLHLQNVSLGVLDVSEKRPRVAPGRHAALASLPGSIGRPASFTTPVRTVLDGTSPNAALASLPDSVGQLAWIATLVGEIVGGRAPSAEPPSLPDTVG